MEQVLQILKKLQGISGTNDKIKFLSQYKEDKMLKEILNIVYNPRVATNISTKKIDKSVGLIPIGSEIEDKDFIKFISSECSGKDKDIYYIQSYLYQFSEDDQSILKDIITQKLSIGLNYKNINKAFGYQFIEFYEVMLATNADKVLDKIKDEEYVITQKLDGLRFIVVVDKEGNKTAYSRNGLEYDGFNDFIEQLELHPNRLYDGELLYCDDTLKSDDRFRKTNEIARCKGEKDKDLLEYHIFDSVLLDELSEGCKQQTYTQRREYLDTLNSNKYQKIVPVLHRGAINTSVYELLDKIVDSGAEGLMANLSKGVYEFGKRSKNILKFKKFHDIDLLCIGVEEGEGKYKGKLGKIIVSYYGYEVGVGSGFSDEQREYFWDNRDEIIDKIVQIKYFECSQNKNGDLSVRFPVFIRVREDKKEVSYD